MRDIFAIPAELQKLQARNRRWIRNSLLESGTIVKLHDVSIHRRQGEWVVNSSTTAVIHTKPGVNLFCDGCHETIPDHCFARLSVAVNCKTKEVICGSIVCKDCRYDDPCERDKSYLECPTDGCAVWHMTRSIKDA